MCFLFIVQFLELNISVRENFTETIRKDIFYLERFSKKIAQRSLIFNMLNGVMVQVMSLMFSPRKVVMKL